MAVLLHIESKKHSMSKKAQESQEKDPSKKATVNQKGKKGKSAAKSSPGKDKKAIEDAQEALAAEKEKYLRLFAEFENFKKRTSKERIALFKTAGQEVILSLLPVVDDLERALEESSKRENAEDFQGFKLIANKLNETLKAQGLVAMNVEPGESFDVECHEAITQIPAGDEQSGKIIDVTAKGYQLGDKIIRYPKVVVGQ